MHMVGIGRSDALASTRGSGGAAATFLNCKSPASAATIRWMASQRWAARIWSALRAGFPIPIGPIHSAASREGMGTSSLYCVTLLAPLSST